MATETIRPNNNGDETSIAGKYPDSPPQHYKKVMEVVADEGSTYVYTSSTSYERDLYNLSNHVEGAGTINKITVFVRVIRGAPEA